MKALVVLVVAAAALAAASAVAAGNRVVERGIVQLVEPTQVVLRALDGTDVTIAVGPATRIRLNGQPTTLASILRGYVAEAVTAGNGPAIVIRAFGRIEQGVEIGRLVRIRPHTLVVRSDAGTVRPRCPDARVASGQGRRGAHAPPRHARPGRPQPGRRGARRPRARTGERLTCRGAAPSS